MNTKLPSSVDRIVSDVIKSWGVKRSNYILVAPPGTATTSVFSCLADTEIHRSLLADSASQLAIASLRETSFKRYDVLVRDILKCWGLDSEVEIDSSSPLDALSPAMTILESRNQVAVLLIDNFHRSMKDLDGDLAIVLRDLENGQFLKTVVSLPVTLEELQRRAALDPDSKGFIQSDWGQGHRQKMLTGYSEEEINGLLRNKGVTAELGKVFLRSTAGLPYLVDRVIEQVRPTMTADSLETMLRSEAPDLCRRMLKWLDCEGEDIYQRLVVEALHTGGPSMSGVSLSNHSWANLLLDKEGNFNCKMLGWAAIEELSSQGSAPFVDLIVMHLRNDRFLQARSILPRARLINKHGNDVLRAVNILIRFCVSANVLEAHWTDSLKCLKEIELFVGNGRDVRIERAKEVVSRWRDLVDLMGNYSIENKARKGLLKLEQFVCEINTEAAFRAFLHLWRLRIIEANKLAPLPAIKLVIAQPESIIQVYAFFEFGFRFWEGAEIDVSVVDRVREITKRPFEPPVKRKPIGFYQLIWLCYVASDSKGAENRLWQHPDEVLKLDEQYNIRSRKVHSAAFASSDDWRAFRGVCMDMVDRVAAVVLSEARLEDLPNPVDSICELLLDVGQQLPARAAAHLTVGH